jgi:gas vesicle protein
VNIKELTYLMYGATAGAAVALLLAPRSGSDTRKYLRTKAADVSDCVKVNASDALNAISDVADRGKKAVRYQAENIADAVDAGVETYRVAVQTTP